MTFSVEDEIILTKNYVHFCSSRP